MADYETCSWPTWHRHMLYVFIAHLFTLDRRLKFKKPPILTMPQAKRLITAALTGSRSMVRKAIKDVDYHMRRNYIAYLSHPKKNAWKAGGARVGVPSLILDFSKGMLPVLLEFMAIMEHIANDIEKIHEGYA